MGRKVKLMLEAGTWIVDLDGLVHAEWRYREEKGEAELRVCWSTGRFEWIVGERARALWIAMVAETRVVEFFDPLERLEESGLNVGTSKVVPEAAP